MINEISFCEVCGSTDLVSVLDLGMHPLCDDLVPMDSNRKCEEYPIEILHCPKCNTSHQRFQVDKKVLFPRTYHYRASLTNDVLDGMKNLVNEHINQYGDIKGLKVLDVGCNDGSLLDYFKEMGASTYGLDPTDAVVDANLKHVCYQKYFDENSAEELHNEHGLFDIITFTNVFAHISNLETVIKGLSKLMHKSSYLVIENHYLSSILKSNQFDTFYHEHPRTYSLNSFQFIAEKLNLNISSIEFPSRYGGNVRVTLSKQKPVDQETIKTTLINERENTLSDYEKMNEFIDSWRSKKSEEIFKICKNSKVAGKAFPARASILIKLLGLDESCFAEIYEKPKSPKIGHYVPGTKIGIYSDEDLFKNPDKYDYIINLAWHLNKEIESYFQKNNIKSKLINIL